VGTSSTRSRIHPSKCLFEMKLTFPKLKGPPCIVLFPSFLLKIYSLFDRLNRPCPILFATRPKVAPRKAFRGSWYPWKMKKWKLLITQSIYSVSEESMPRTVWCTFNIIESQHNIFQLSFVVRSKNGGDSGSIRCNLDSGTFTVV